MGCTRGTRDVLAELIEKSRGMDVVDYIHTTEDYSLKNVKVPAKALSLLLARGTAVVAGSRVSYLIYKSVEEAVLRPVKCRMTGDLVKGS